MNMYFSLVLLNCISKEYFFIFSTCYSTSKNLVKLTSASLKGSNDYFAQALNVNTVIIVVMGNTHLFICKKYYSDKYFYTFVH